ncbi:MAG: hypothetical protein CVT96_11930 [Bacteroidetes bacterium HGW-Bacteroidetes-13]|nr:MAG: hypothetical protein CVT96_11930 [Bacteroidetes bacterium HGW-Bacteroidetes-13]
MGVFWIHFLKIRSKNGVEKNLQENFGLLFSEIFQFRVGCFLNRSILNFFEANPMKLIVLFEF